MSKARPTVSVYKADATAEKSGLCLPQVFQSALRPDVVRIVHTNMNKNRRQAVAVKNEAGYDTAAASWGTGRAVARIPRVPGGGTHRSGQGAFGNMCRGGGMFNPTKTWRRWHRKTNVTQKRHALAASLAASAVPALVMARGHAIDEVPELPLVISSESNKIAKTKEAVALLKALGCSAELEKVKESRKIRCGKGKARNRRYVMKKGPLVVHALTKEEATDASLAKAFRNIPGVEVAHVDRLNLLQLAPGGAFGRFCIYTEGAMKRLTKLYGTLKGGSQIKKGYTLPRSCMTNTDITRIINSNEVQSALNARKEAPKWKSCSQKKNPLKNKSVLGRLSPWATVQKHIAPKSLVKKSADEKKASKKKATKKAHKAASKAFYKARAAAHAPKVETVEEEAEE